MCTCMPQRDGNMLNHKHTHTHSQQPLCSQTSTNPREHRHIHSSNSHSTCKRPPHDHRHVPLHRFTASVPRSQTRRTFSNIPSSTSPTPTTHNQLTLALLLGAPVARHTPPHPADLFVWGLPAPRGQGPCSIFPHSPPCPTQSPLIICSFMHPKRIRVCTFRPIWMWIIKTPNALQP